MNKYPSVNLMLVALAVSFSANVCGQEVLAKFETKWDNEAEPEGTYMTGVAAISVSEGDDDPHLHLTDAVNGANGGLMIEDFTDGAAFKDFEISFRLHMTDSTCCGSGDDTNTDHRPADGLSISIGNDLPDTFDMAEEGTGNGVRICFDTYDNGGGEAPAIDFWSGAAPELQARQKFNGATSAADEEKFRDGDGNYVWLWTQGEWADVKITVFEGLLTVNYKGFDVISKQPVRFAPLHSPNWLFAARTGGANETHWIDDLEITVHKFNRTDLASIHPAPGEKLVRREAIEVQIFNGEDIKVDQDTVQLTLNDSVVDAELSESDGFVTVSHVPADGMDEGVYTARITYSESNGKERSREWSFSVPSIYKQGGEVPTEAQGGLTVREYHEIEGSDLDKLLFNADKFPESPDFEGLASYFEWPQTGDIDAQPPRHVRDNYGWHLMGYIHPPETGYYVFAAATDDNSQLWLSTDSDPANAVQIAGESQWRGLREYEGWQGDESTSEPVILKKGKVYFIECLAKEGGGSENMAVAWSGPVRTIQMAQELRVDHGSRPISGDYLSPFTWTGPDTPEFVVASPSGRSTVTDSKDFELKVVINNGEDVKVSEVTKLEVNGESFLEDAFLFKGGVSTMISAEASGNPATEMSATVAWKNTDGTVGSHNWSFITSPHSENALYIEAEDFNYDSGEWMTFEDSDGGGAYNGFGAVSGIDFGAQDDSNPEIPNEYRIISDKRVATFEGGDRGRGDWEMETDFMVGWNDGGDWYNYTRDFPEEALYYNVFGRFSGENIVMRLSQVTSDATEEDQAIEDLGVFRSPSSGWNTKFYPLQDEKGDLVAVKLGGETTVRLTKERGGVDANYMVFVKAAVQEYPPLLAGFGPVGKRINVDTVGARFVKRELDFEDLSMTVNGETVEVSTSTEEDSITVTAQGAPNGGDVVLNWNGLSHSWSYHIPDFYRDGADPYSTPKGSITVREYYGVEGVQVRDLVRAPQFPGEANRTEDAGYFEWPQTGNIQEAPEGNRHDNYGVQLVGFVHPPITGRYRFYIAADEQAHLWLSTDENPANRQLIAVEPQWNGVRDFTNSERRHVVDEGTDDERLVNASKYIELEAGKAYFIEALMKEGGGGDNVAVTAIIEGGDEIENGALPISGNFLSPWIPLPSISGFSGGIEGVSINIAFVEQNPVDLDSVRVILEGDWDNPVSRSITTENGVMTIDYSPEELLSAGDHYVDLEYRDSKGNWRHNGFHFFSPEYRVLDPGSIAPVAIKGDPGFLAYVTQISNGQGVGELHGNHWQNAEKQIRGEYIDPQTGEPFINEANPEAFGGDGMTYYPVILETVNLNQDSGGDVVVEFDGWTFVDPVWWNETSGGQERSQFTKGTGVIAVADSDEFDDKTNAGFNSTLSTPPIDISTALEGSLILTYDSSWRQEPQHGRLTVTFDGGDAVTLLELTPDSPTAFDETVEIRLNNPEGASTAVISWEKQGRNNWWWAIDNIEVTGASVDGDPTESYFWEDFDSLELDPSESDSECCGDGTDWTATAPDGWAIDIGEGHGPGNIGNFAGDEPIPGIPGWGESTDGIAAEFVTLLELERGVHTLGVNSDDGFRATIGANFADVTTQQIGLFNGRRGASDSVFAVWVEKAGLYPFRVSWWEGGGGANIEIFSIVDGQKVLINDPDVEGSIKAYTIQGAVVGESTTERATTGRPEVISLYPRPGDKLVKRNLVEVKIKNNEITVDQDSIELTLDGEIVDPSISVDDDIVTISYVPTDGLDLGSHEVGLTLDESSGAGRGLDWDFNVPSIYNRVGDVPTEAQGGLTVREYHEIWGPSSIDRLFNAEHFPHEPDVNTIAGYFEWPQTRNIDSPPLADVRNDYGWHLLGYIHPPETGEYIFAVATDDNSQLWLSTDSDPANAVQITNESEWREVRNYQPQNDESTSAPVYLEAGKVYFIECFAKEGGGGDNMAVAWSLPSDEGADVEPGALPISGEYLSPFRSVIDPEPAPVVLSAAPYGSSEIKNGNKIRLRLFNRGLDIMKAGYQDSGVEISTEDTKGNWITTDVITEGFYTTIMADAPDYEGFVDVNVEFKWIAQNGDIMEASEEWSYFSFKPPVEGEANPILYFDFDHANNPRKAYDDAFGLVARVHNAVYTDDTPTGSGSAMDMTDAWNGHVFLDDAEVLNIASSVDQVTVSFWQKNRERGRSTSSFWAWSPSTGGDGRAMQAHVPWGNGWIYWDTAGCCSGEEHRIEADANDFVEWGDGDGPRWNHYAFVKDGEEKTIWINGDLFHEGINSAPLPSDIEELFIGSDGWGDYSVNGIIDDFAVFAAALDEEQIWSIVEGSTDLYPAKREIYDFVDITTSGDPIYPSSENSPTDETGCCGSEESFNAIDNNSDTKYLNLDAANDGQAGFAVTPSHGVSVITGITMQSANDADDRDPRVVLIEGTNDDIDSYDSETVEWLEIVVIEDIEPWEQRFEYKEFLFKNDQSFKSYRWTVLETQGPSGCCMQIAEVEFLVKEGATPGDGPKDPDDGPIVIEEESFGDPVTYTNIAPTLIGQLTINGKAAGAGDIVGIYVGDELRGKQEVSIDGEGAFSPAGTAWVNAQVHSAGGQEPATFKVYEASTGITFERVAVGAVVIEPDTNVGSFVEPLLIRADNVAPAIVLLGGEEVSITVGSEYEDAGAIATDNVDGELTGQIVVNGVVDMTKAGVYTLIYSVSDAAGNTATATRTVTVEKIPALLRLSGFNQTYDGSAKELNATVVDSADNELDVKIVMVYRDDAGEIVASATSAGTYSVTATIDDDLYAGTATATLTVEKAEAVVMISDTTQTYDGEEKRVIVTTEPAGLDVDSSYNGSETGPTEAGEYEVSVEVEDANYMGGATTIFTIVKDPFGEPVAYANNTQTVYGTVTIDGKAASKGDDVVAVYVGDELRGKHVIQAVDEGVAYVTIQVNVNEAGEQTSRFVVWDADQSDEEFQTLTLRKKISLAPGGETQLLAFDFKSTVIQEVSLKEGWNLISFYVESDDMTPATVLGSIKDKLVQIKNLKNSYNPTLPAFINTLKGLNVKDGYWVKMDAEVSFELEGSVPEGASIPVRTGWNLVGYPRENGAAPADELTSLGNTVLQFKNLKDSYNPALPAFINTLKVIAPGLGYWLNVNDDGMWNVGDVSGEGGNGRGISKMTSLDESRWGRVVVYPNVSATVLAEVSVGGEPVAEGSMVVAHTGDELRGQHEVVLANGRSYVTLNISLDGTERVTFRISDAGTEREYLVGNEMQLRMGEMYGERQLVKLDGMLPLVGRTLQIGQYERKPFGFSFETVTGGNYVVEFSQDLKEWGQLQEYKGTGKLINFVDSRPSSLHSGKSFYRIRVDQ